MPLSCAFVPWFFPRFVLDRKLFLARLLVPINSSFGQTNCPFHMAALSLCILLPRRFLQTDTHPSRCCRASTFPRNSKPPWRQA